MGRIDVSFFSIVIACWFLERGCCTCGAVLSAQSWNYGFSDRFYNIFNQFAEDYIVLHNGKCIVLLDICLFLRNEVRPFDALGGWTTTHLVNV